MFPIDSGCIPTAIQFKLDCLPVTNHLKRTPDHHADPSPVVSVAILRQFVQKMAQHCIISFRQTDMVNPTLFIHVYIGLSIMVYHWLCPGILRFNDREVLLLKVSIKESPPTVARLL